MTRTTETIEPTSHDEIPVGARIVCAGRTFRKTNNRPCLYDHKDGENREAEWRTDYGTYCVWSDGYIRAEMRLGYMFNSIG